MRRSTPSANAASSFDGGSRFRRQRKEDRDCFAMVLKEVERNGRVYIETGMERGRERERERAHLADMVSS